MTRKRSRPQQLEQGPRAQPRSGTHNPSSVGSIPTRPIKLFAQPVSCGEFAARARGEDLTGPDRLLKTLTKTVLETALEEEISEHLGYDKHAVEGRNWGNSLNGRRTKTVVSTAAESGPRVRQVNSDPLRVGWVFRSGWADGGRAGRSRR